MNGVDGGWIDVKSLGDVMMMLGEGCRELVVVARWKIGWRRSGVVFELDYW